jgi:hypothetical protein
MTFFKELSVTFEKQKATVHATKQTWKKINHY